MAQWKISGGQVMHCCRIVNVIKNKKHKKQPWEKAESPNDFAWQGRDTSRPLQMTDIQYGITIMGGRNVPTGFGFSPKASGFLCFFVSVPPEFIHRTEKMAKCVG